MFTREIGTNKRNSIAYNPENDDLTFNNYLCLYSVIQSKTINPNNILSEINRIKKCFGLVKTENRKKENNDKNKVKKEKTNIKSKYEYTDIVMTDTETGEVFKFNTTKECAEHIGIKHSSINGYIKK